MMVSSLCPASAKLCSSFAKSRACFCPAGRVVALVGDDPPKLSICKAKDGSQVVSLIGFGIRQCKARFNAFGDVLILANADDIRVVCFDWGANAGTKYSQQVCNRVASACKLADTLSHSCCACY